MLTITLSVLLVLTGLTIIYFAILLYRACVIISIAYGFIEKISDQLVPIVNGDIPPSKASTLRNDIKLFLIYEKYDAEENRTDFRRRRPQFVKKYNLQ